VTGAPVDGEPLPAGKTTWCLQLAKLAEEQGLRVKGILSPGEYQGERKIAIQARAIESREERQLAILREIDKSELSTPRWQFNPETVSWANDILMAIDSCDLLIIDELGPLELLGEKGFSQHFFWRAVVRYPTITQ